MPTHPETVVLTAPPSGTETGSGKTGAFGLPIVQLVMESRRQVKWLPTCDGADFT